MADLFSMACLQTSTEQTKRARYEASFKKDSAFPKWTELYRCGPFGIFERMTLNSSERFRVTRMVTSILSWAKKNCQWLHKPLLVPPWNYQEHTYDPTRWMLLGAVRHSRRRPDGETQKPSVPNGIVLVVSQRTQLVWRACGRFSETAKRSELCDDPSLAQRTAQLICSPRRTEKVEEKAILRNTLVEEQPMLLREIREHGASRGQTQS